MVVVFVTEDLGTIPFAIPTTYDELVHMKFSDELIARNINFTNTFSSPGQDNIPYVTLKTGGSLIVRQLRRLFQFCFDNSFVLVQ